ncbi:hypothetical protein [Sneathiella aquimaris]|uniref:hypothetical protein n=1 Tax=Sneathiella aquimaris TaxID=2599305 RepID=UPI00146A4F0A|nr:hypothetical protein [Sneathiella aquimaris]
MAKNSSGKRQDLKQRPPAAPRAGYSPVCYMDEFPDYFGLTEDKEDKTGDTPKSPPLKTDTE